MKKFLLTLVLGLTFSAHSASKMVDAPHYFPKNFKFDHRVYIKYLQTALKLGENNKMPESTRDGIALRLQKAQNDFAQSKKYMSSRTRSAKRARRYARFLAIMRRDLWMDPYMQKTEYTEKAINLLPLEDRIPSNEERFGVPHLVEPLVFYFPWHDAAKKEAAQQSAH